MADKANKEVAEKKAAKKQEETVVAEVATEETQTEETKKPAKEVSLKESNPEKFLADFNWHNYEEGIDPIDDGKLEEFEKLVAENFVDTLDDEVVEGKVVYITDRDAIIDINAKSEGVVSLNEFRYNPDLKVGDKVEVLIDVREDSTGQLILSHRKARTIKAWDRVNAAHDEGTIVNGYVKCRTKGGMIVDVFGIEAFLPGSQIDVKPIRDYDVYVGKTMEFKVVKINHEFKNVVVSHKALIEADIEEQKKEIIGQLEKGQVLEGVVKNITSYGVFVDLGGVDGLVHITDLSWSRINHPNE
ncbi:MAG: S1 RNA-binding domain-containing protein, partial [Aequorivita sp.]|nr:S1 RNA-binding domain-containing protein [Aequorivita sp.]